ncbi:multidrug transporter subunit MdtD [Orbaceae bacterium ac157xtp]
MNDKQTIITPMMLKWLPWIAAVSFFMQNLDSSILNTALPAIAKDLNESPLNMQSAVICYALAVALFIPVSGFFSDRFGTRNVFIFAVSLFSIGSLMCAFANTLLLLDFSRIVQGIGGAMMVPVSRLTLIKSFPRDQFLEALNTSTLPGLVGPIVGPLLGGYLVDYASWHWIFLINIPIGIIGVIAGFVYMPNLRGVRMRFDFVGVCLISSAIVSSTLALECINEGVRAIMTISLFIGCAVMLILYLFYAKKTLSPIFPLVLFNIHTFRIGILGNLISRLGISSAPFLIPLLLQVGFSFSAIHSGLMLMPMAIAAFVMRAYVQRILARFGYRRVLVVNTIFIGAIIISISLLGKEPSLVIFGILLFLLGGANSLQFTAMNSITLADLQGDLTSSGNSLMAVNQQLAISFGIGFATVLLKVFEQQTTLIHGDIVNAFNYSFIVLGIVTCLSSLIFCALYPQDGKNLINKSN